MTSYRIYLNTIETRIIRLFQVEKNGVGTVYIKLSTLLVYNISQIFMVLDTVCSVLCYGTQGLITILILYALTAYIRRKIAKPNYEGKIVWVTGASSGIGEYLAY